MTLAIQVRGDEQMVAWLRRQPLVVQDAVARKMEEVAQRISDRTKQKLSGEVLRVRTGRLRSSIAARAYQTGRKITVSIASRGDVPYAAIHEYGGSIRPHVIRPRSAQVLAFLSNGKRGFAQRVRHPGAKMRENSYIRSTVQEMLPDINAYIESGIREAFER